MRGFDNHSINSQLLYALSLEEMTGAAGAQIYDRAKPHHTSFLRGATIAWGALASGLPYLDLTATPDFIDCPAADTADLDFMAGDFSIVLWASTHLGGDRMLVCRGLLDTDGWYLYSTPAISFRTNQLGASQLTNGGTLLNTLTLVGVTRILASVRIFVNGNDETFTTGTHIAPATADRELHIGVADDEGANPLDGLIAGGPCGPRIWGRGLSPAEHLSIFNSERHWIGV